MRFFLSAAVIGALSIAGAGFQATSAHAQTPDTRIFGSWGEPVKLEDGTEVTHRYEISYDYRLNHALLTVHDETGRMISSRVMDRPPEPHPEEKAEARALITADPELSQVLATVEEPVIAGGFIYYEDRCRDLRCLQFAIEPADGSRLERFVVVELSSQTILERDLYPHLRD